MLKDNNVEVFLAGGAPAVPALQEIEISKPIKVLPIDEEKLESVEEKGLGIASGELPGGDRKSTRLNSSHVAISYAVFCLKKTTRNEKEPMIHTQVTWTLIT